MVLLKFEPINTMFSVREGAGGEKGEGLILQFYLSLPLLTTTMFCFLFLLRRDILWSGLKTVVSEGVWLRNNSSSSLYRNGT